MKPKKKAKKYLQFKKRKLQGVVKSSADLTEAKKKSRKIKKLLKEKKL